MRLLAAIITLVFLGSAGLAGHALWVMSGMAGPQARSVLLTTPETPNRNIAVNTGPANTAPSSPIDVRHWPPLFGEPQPPAPPEAQPPVAAQPTSTPKPPLESLGYTLNGVVRTDKSVWAMVGHPAGGRLLRKGDVLEPGVIVSRIDAKGLWVSRYDDPPELLAFPEKPLQ